MGMKGALALTTLLTTAANAADFSLGPVNGSMNTRITLGASMRVEKRDERLIAKLAVPGQEDLCSADDCQSQSGDPAPNLRLVNARGAFAGVNEDNGNLNYDKGDITAAVAQLRPRLDLYWNSWNLRASGTIFYDLINAGFNEHHADTLYQPEQTRRPHAIERRFANGYQLGDLYVASSWYTQDGEIALKIGNQVLSWGEANLVQFNNLSAWNPLDATALTQPGFELARLQMAVPLATVTATLSANTTVEAVYQLKWQGAALPPSGSPLSFNDIAGGGRYAILGLGNYHEDPNREFVPAGLAATVSQSTRTVAVPDEDFGAPRDNGQYGVRLTHLAEWLNGGTELSLQYMRYHSRLPYLSAYAADASCTRDAAAPGFAGAFEACQGFNASFNPTGREPLPVDTIQLFQDFPEDIDLLGLSFNTNVGNWAISGEYAYRPNVPLQILQTDVLFAALGPAFPAQDIAIGANSVTDPSVLGSLPAALGEPLAQFQNALLTQLPAGATFTIPGEDHAVPDYLSQYRGITVNAGDYVPGFERQTVSQMSLTGLRVLAHNPVGASQVIFVGEVGGILVHDLPGRSQPYFEGAADRTHPSAGNDGTGDPNGEPDARRVNPTQMTDGFGDSFSWGYRALLRLTYNELPGDLVLYPTLVWMEDVHGTSPMPLANFIHGRHVMIANLSGEFGANWGFGLTYQRFGGADTRNRLRDRDNISVNVSYVF